MNRYVIPAAAAVMVAACVPFLGRPHTPPAPAAAAAVPVCPAPQHPLLGPVDHHVRYQLRLRRTLAAQASRSTERAAPPRAVEKAAPTVTPTPAVVVSPDGGGGAASPTGFDAWVSSSEARYIVWRESRGSCTVVNSSGHGGRWQFDVVTWISNGGGKYASAAQYATCHEQDLIAYVTWQRRGWSPWAL